MRLPVMAPTERDSKLITNLTAERRGLRKAQMVGIRRTPAADETGLLGDRFDMLPVTDSARRRQCQYSFVNSGASSCLSLKRSSSFFSRRFICSANAC